MSNTLVKNTNTSIVAGVAGTRGDPGQPYRPAYTAYERKTICTFVSAGGDLEWSLQSDASGTAQYEYSLRPVVSSGMAVASGSYQCATRTVPVYYPAQEYVAPTPGTPASPAQTIYDFNLGWNAGARSNKFVLNDGYVQFRVPYALVGGVLGLNNVDIDASYPNMEHAFYFSGKTARVYELGVEVSYLGAYADGDTFKILRHAGVVTYYKNGTLVYTSALQSSDVFFLDASLYCGADYVYDPVIAGLNSSGASMLPLVGSGGNIAYAQSQGEMQPLTSDVLSNAIANRGAGSLQPLAGLGSSKNTALTVWPDDVYPDVLSGSVSGVVTGTMPEITLIDGVISGTLRDSDGNVVGFIQGSALGTDPGTGDFTGSYTAVITDAQTGAVIGYVSGAITGTDSTDAAVDYVASVTGDAIYVLTPVAPNNDAASVAVDGAVTGTVGSDGTLTGSYTGTITNPVTGEVVGIVTGSVTGTVNPDGTYSGIFTGVVTDPVTGAVIGVITGTVSGIGTLTPNGDGSSSFTASGSGAEGTGTFVPTAPPTVIYTSSYGEGHGSLQPLSGAAGVLPPPPKYALAAGALIQLTGAGLSKTGSIGGGPTTMRALTGMSSGSPHTVPAIPPGGAQYPGAGAVTGTISGTTSDPTTGHGAFTGTGSLTGDFAGPITVAVAGTVDGAGNFTGTYTYDVYVSGVLIGTSTGTLTGTVTGTTLVTGPVTGTGSFLPYYAPFNYGESRGTLLPIAGYASAFEGNNNASLGAIAQLGMNWTTTTVLAVVMTSSGTIAAVLAVNITADADLYSDVDVAHTMTFTSLLNALIQTTVSVGAVVPPYEEDGLVYVLNLDSAATSTYEQFPFNSYARIGGAYYGMKSDGLFALEGDDDAGTGIASSVSFGKQDFGSPERKRLTAAYIGLSSTNKIYLKVTTAAGAEYVYAARRSDDFQRQQRIDVGRGIEATYMTFELINKGGADFELSTVEFQAVKMNRRV